GLSRPAGRFDVQLETPAVAGPLGPERLWALTDPANYLGAAPAMVDRGGRDGDWGCAEHDWAGPERIGAGRAPRLREGGLSAADTATGRGTPENDLQGPEAAPRSRGPGRADDTR